MSKLPYLVGHAVVAPAVVHHKTPSIPTLPFLAGRNKKIVPVYHHK
jgi:hypothetical protein